MQLLTCMCKCCVYVAISVVAAVVAQPVAGSPPSAGERVTPVPAKPVERAPSGKCK